MKFYIERTSNWNDERPHERAVKITQGRVYAGLFNYSWEIEFDTLEDLLGWCSDTDDVIIKWRAKEGTPVIEIYDTYRE